MIQQRPPFFGRLAAMSLLYLLLIAFTQVNLFKCQDTVDSSASGYPCVTICPPGYECSFGVCKPETCKNCSATNDSSPVCGSGTTYANLCELEKARCETGKDIRLERNGPCVTSAPPVKTCNEEYQTHLKIFANETAFYDNCVSPQILGKSTNGSLSLSDTLRCYLPKCDRSSKFTPKQCGYLYFNHWCWCTQPDGTIIPDTFQQNMPNGFCSDVRRKQCEVNGVVYNHQQAYTPDGVCGRCECVNGTHSCFVNYTGDEDGQLDSEQVIDLKQKLIQVYNFQKNHDEHIITDIGHILDNSVDVVSPQKEIVLDWKFDFYDTNKNSDLSPVEEFRFHGDISKFLGSECSSYYDQLTSLMDTNKNKKISNEEWRAFFQIDESASDTTSTTEAVAQPVKRDTSPLSPLAAKKPLHLRKRFLYVLH